MLKRFLLIGFCMVALCLTACNFAPAPTRKPTFVVAESKAYEASLFRQNCAICHGAEADGKEINGKLIPSLRVGDARRRTEQEIYEQIANGKLPMPSFRNQLSEEDIRKMVKFIKRDLQGRDD